MKPNEMLLQAEYADIVLTLLQPPYNISSIAEVVFVSFCIKHETNISRYNNRTKDFIGVFFSNIALKLIAHECEIGQILQVIDLLRKNSKIQISGDNIMICSSFSFNGVNKFLDFCKNKNPNPILEVCKLDSRAMLEEVLRYV